MICKNCGEDNRAGAKYCNSCGANLNSENGVDDSVDNRNSYNRKRTIIAIAVGVVAVLIVFVILDLIIFGNIKGFFKDDEASSGNLLSTQTEKTNGDMELNGKTPEPTIEITEKPKATENHEATDEPEATVVPEATDEPEATVVPEATDEPEATVVPKPTYVPVEEDSVDAKLFRFYDDTSYMWDSDYFFGNEGHNCYPSYDDALFIDIKGYDPFVTVDGRGEGESDEYFSLAEYPVMKICLKNATPSTVFEMFLAAGAGDKAEDCFQAEISADDEEFKTYVFDFTELKGQGFVDARAELNHVRLDCVSLGEHEENASSAGWSFEIAYFGFFKTVEDAETWVPADYDN